MSEATKIKVKTKPKTDGEPAKKLKRPLDFNDASDSGSLQLDIRSRPIMRAGDTPKDSETDSHDDRSDQPSAPALSGSTKKIVPVSVHSGDESDDAGPADKPPVTDEKQPDEKPEEDAESDQDSTLDTGESEESDEKSESNGQANADDKTEQAVKAAEAQLKRESELEDLINKREFYVPINARARKRSTNISAVMILFVVILAGALIDLMLDSGMIQLPQNIPHTHIFSGINNSLVQK